MALQSSGQISFGNIALEKNIPLSNLSLNTLATTNFNTDPCNLSNADNGAPHSLSEWFGYDHSCITSSGPELVQETWLGFYRDELEACERGQFNDSDSSLTAYVDREKNIAYIDDLGKNFVRRGIYYSIEMGSAAIVDRDDGFVLYALCGGFKPRL